MLSDLNDNRKNFIENKFSQNCFEMFPKPRSDQCFKDEIEDFDEKRKSKLQEQLNNILHNVYNLEYVQCGARSFVFTGMRVLETLDENKKLVNSHIPCAVKISKEIMNMLSIKKQEEKNERRNQFNRFEQNNHDKKEKESNFYEQQFEVECFHQQISIGEQLQKLNEIMVRSPFAQGFQYHSFGAPNFLETIIQKDIPAVCVIMEKFSIDLYGFSRVNSISDQMKLMFYDTTQKNIEFNFLRLILQLIKILNFYHYSGLVGNQHKESMIHCNIISKNIMILEQDSKFTVKFTSLGSTILERDNQNSLIYYSKGFVSQEIKRNLEISSLINYGYICPTQEEIQKYVEEQNSLFPTKADDIWSMGVTIFQLFAQYIQAIKIYSTLIGCIDYLYCTSTKLHNLFEDNLQNLFKNSDYQKYQRKSDSLIFKAGAKILYMIFSATREERNRKNFLNPIIDCLIKWETQAQQEAQLIFISEKVNLPNPIVHGGSKLGIYTNIAALLLDMRYFFIGLEIIPDIEKFPFYTSMKKFLMEFEEKNQVQYFTKSDFLSILIKLISYISDNGVWIRKNRSNQQAVAQTLYIAILYSLEFETKTETLHTSVFYIMPYSAILKRPMIKNIREIEKLLQ